MYLYATAYMNYITEMKLGYKSFQIHKMVYTSKITHVLKMENGKNLTRTKPHPGKMLGQNPTRTKLHPDKTPSGQYPTRTKPHPGKTQPGQIPTSTINFVLPI